MAGRSSPDAEEMMPYDLNAPVVEIEDEDYGIFHMDVMEHPELIEPAVKPEQDVVYF